MKEILPTRWALSKKGVAVSVECPFCGLDREDELHVFKNCDVVNLLWKCGPLKLSPKSHPATTIVFWLGDMVDSFQGEQLEFFLLSLWAVWVERNNLVWRGGCFVPQNVAKWICNQIEEYKKLHGRSPKKKIRVPMKWQCPPRGRLKVNIDGSYLAESGSGGVGVVVRDADGGCRAALARPLLSVISALHAEVESLRAGLLVALHQG